MSSEWTGKQNTAMGTEGFPKTFGVSVGLVHIMQSPLYLNSSPVWWKNATDDYKTKRLDFSATKPDWVAPRCPSAYHLDLGAEALHVVERM